MATAFQPNAFQNNAFQIEGITKKVGWPSGYRHDPEELERRLKRQRDNQLTQRRFDELLAEAEQRAARARNKVQRKAIKKALAEVRELAVEELPDPAILLQALEAAARATKVSESIRAARQVAKLYADYEAMMAEDEEEALMLLLH